MQDKRVADGTDTLLTMFAYLQLLRTHPHFLGFGVLLCASASFGQTWFISLFGGEIRAAFSLSHGDFGAIYSAATLASGVSLVWVGRLLDRVTLPRFSSAVFMGLGLAALGMWYCPNIMVLGLAFFGLRLCGQGLLTHISVTSMARYFDANRGKAISVATLGFPLTETVFPLTVVAVSAAVGWQTSWLVWSLVVLAGLLPLSLYLLQRSQYLWQPLDVSAAQRHTVETSPSSISTSGWTRERVVRDRRFHLVLPYLLAPAFISTGIMFHQVHLVDSKGWPLEWFAAGFVAYGIAKIVGSLIGGPLVDRYSARALFPWFLAPMSLGVLLLGMTDAPLVAFVFLALTGVTNGLSGPIGGAFWAEVYGTGHLGAIRALAVAIMVVGSALSPVVFGSAFDAGISFSATLYASFAIAAGATALAFIAMRLPADEFPG